jgi:uncharacterized membrane protein YheB (UPF0754 family)
VTWLPWVLLPAVGALIGFATNWLAIKMLFHPRQKRFGLQGLLPRRQKELAASVGDVVADELLDLDQLLSGLDTVDLRPSFEELIDRALEAKIHDLKRIPLIGSMITPERLSGIRNSVIEELVKAQPTIVAKLKDIAREKVDIRTAVSSRLEGFDLLRLESVVTRVASKEMRAIEWWGAIVGGLIGLVQAAILALLG